MNDKLYTREDMRRAYEEGGEYYIYEEYGRGNKDSLPFEEFMLKHHPTDLTDAYVVSWLLHDNPKPYKQMIVAEDQTEAIKKATRMLEDKRMKPKQFNIEKVVIDL